MLEELERADDPAVRWVPSHQWHVTLRFWPDAAVEPVVGALDAALAARPSTLQPATAHLGPRIHRLGPSAIVVPVEGLDELAGAVRSATDPEPSEVLDHADGRSGSRSSSDGRVVRGHLTLGRFRGRPRRGASTSVLGAPVDAAFDVREIELVDSELGVNGATHRIVGTWSLAT